MLIMTCLDLLILQRFFLPSVLSVYTCVCVDMQWAMGAIVLEDFVSSFHVILLTLNIFSKMHVLL